MINITELKRMAHKQELSIRCINLLISKDEFELIFKGEKEVIKYIETNDLISLRQWYYRNLDKLPMCMWTLRVARTVAKKLGVKNYYRLPKGILLSKIKGMRNEKKI